MFGLGFSEIVLLGVLALIVIGPKQLPELARAIGRFMNELKRTTSEFSDEIKAQARADLDFDLDLENKNQPKSEPQAEGESAAPKNKENHDN